MWVYAGSPQASTYLSPENEKVNVKPVGLEPTLFRTAGLL